MVKSVESNVNCSSLYRVPLSSTSCGGCLINYIGDKDTRVSCVSSTSATFASKRCPNDCNGNGTCIYSDINTGNVIDKCNLLSDTCISKCLCNSGMTGSSCDTSIEELKAVQSQQESLLTQILTVASEGSRQSNDVVKSIITATCQILSIADDKPLSSASIELSSNIISKTMLNALKSDVSISDVVVYNNIVDNVIQSGLTAISGDSSSSDGSSSSSSSSNTQMSSLSVSDKENIQNLYESYVDSIGQMSMKAIMSGTSNVTITTTNMALSVSKMSLSNSISCLGSSAHSLNIIDSSFARRLGVVKSNNRSSSSNEGRSLFDASVLQSKTIPIMLSVTRASLYANSRDFQLTKNASYNERVQLSVGSNPLRLQLDCSLVSDTSVIINIQNFAAQDYSDIEPIGNITYVEKCFLGEIKSFTYVCQYADDTRYTIKGTCDGRNGTLTTTCPTRSRTPICYMSSTESESSSSCTLVSQTPSLLTCRCTACPSALLSSRKLKTVKAVTYQIISVTKYMYEDFATTMESSKDLTAADVAKSIIVIMSFVAVWSIVIAIVAVQEFWKYGKKVLFNCF